MGHSVYVPVTKYRINVQIETELQKAAMYVIRVSIYTEKRANKREIIQILVSHQT